MRAQEDISQWLVRLRDAEPGALDQIVSILYRELRALARSRLGSERRDHTLGPTALVHEAYLKLLRQRQIEAEDRGQFFVIASRTMRRILVDYARTRSRKKRGGDQAERIPLEEAEAFLTEEEGEELLALDGALERLAELSPRESQVVECRFFAGLTTEETAEALGISVRSVGRDWTAARAWLRKEVLASEATGDGDG